MMYPQIDKEPCLVLKDFSYSFGLKAFSSEQGQLMNSLEKKKAAIYILTGFLGAGKTTLVKRILSLSSDLSGTVVIVNEFGDVGIDGLLLKDAHSDIVELVGGCICCALKTDLKVTVRRILAELDPKRIIIEASGVADPAAIIEVLKDREFQSLLEIKKVVTVLDPDFWDSRADLGTFFKSQLREADLILLNRIDELGAQRVPKLLREIHAEIPDCRVVPTTYCNVDPGSIWSQDLSQDFALPFHSNLCDSFEAPMQADHHDHGSIDIHPHAPDAESSGFKAFSFQSLKPLDEACFKHFSQQLPWELFRMKGPVRFHDHTVMLNHVGGRNEWTTWDGPQETRLAFVGLGVDPEETIAKLKECIGMRDR